MRIGVPRRRKRRGEIGDRSALGLADAIVRLIDAQQCFARDVEILRLRDRDGRVRCLPRLVRPIERQRQIFVLVVGPRSDARRQQPRSDDARR